MKRLAFILILTLTLALVSCAPADADPLSYQDRASEVTGTVTTETGTFSFVVTLPEMTDVMTRRDADILLTAPETLAGITVTVQGKVVTMSSGDVTLPVSTEAAGGWLELVGLFSLDGNAVSSVTGDGGTVTVGIGAAPCRTLVTIDTAAGTPTQIMTEDGRLSLTIDKYIFTDTNTEGTDTNGN